MADYEQRQKIIFDFIKEYINKYDLPPTIREIGQNTNITSTSVIHKHLKDLEQKGLIKRSQLKKRYIEINRDIPVVGNVYAGNPVLSYENIDFYFAFPKDKDNFMLRVKGDSMIDVGIFDGDLVLVKKQEYANNNEIVIALVEGEATVKRFIKNKDAIYLKPENKNYKPIYSKDIAIIGKVIGLYRNLQ